LALGIANGIAHLHTNKIVHRDLAARNIVRVCVIPLHMSLCNHGMLYLSCPCHNESCMMTRTAQLIMTPLTPKVADFGMSRVLDEDEQNNATYQKFGPIKWMAPERA
jgi:serine/threonine protein kinase